MMNEQSRIGHEELLECPDEDHSKDGTSVAESKALMTFVCFASSVVSFATAADACGSKGTCGHTRMAFATFGGLIAALCCVRRLWLFRNKVVVSQKFDMMFGVVLMVLWAFLLAFNTSTGGPFTETNNGYFSTWFALASAMSFLYHSVTEDYRKKINVEVSRQHTALAIVFVSSVVELAVALDVCAAADACNGHEKFAIFVGLCSCVVVITNHILSRKQHPSAEAFSKMLAPILILLWSFGAGFNTSDSGPFTSSCSAVSANSPTLLPSANGYFSTWASFFASLYYAWNIFLLVSPVTENDVEEDAEGGAGRPYNTIQQGDAFTSRTL